MGKKLDLSGKIFGKVTLISNTGNLDKTGSYLWNCECSCGNKFTAPSYHFTRKTRPTVSCGCGNRDDLLGKTFGKWTVMSLDSVRGTGYNTYWKCRCACGAEHSIRGTCLTKEQSMSCHTCASRDNGLNNRLDDFHVATTNLMGNYRSNAKRRGYKFDLSRDRFQELIKGSCFYCGILPSNVFTSFQRKNESQHSPIMYSGVDRVDNTKDYTDNNCVSCCAQCNYAKSDLSQEQFLAWIRSIYINKLVGIREKTVGMLTDELATTLIKCFMAQEDIMNTDLSVERQKNAAVLAQKLNARRNQLIRSLDEIFGFADNSHTAKTYSAGEQDYTYFKGKDANDSTPKP